MRAVSDARFASLALALALALVAPSAMAAQPDPKVAAIEWIDAEAATLRRVNREVWTYAETALEEKRSSKALQDWLRRNGFTVESGVAGMPTAFVASYGSGRPVIGILAEFDALPGVSQDDSATHKPRPGVTAGHACGHSLLGTGGTAAAIAVKRAIASGAIAGTVRLYGTPAEEIGIGKIRMLRAGIIKDADAVLAWHPRDVTRADYLYTKALVSARFRFEGVAAHAGTAPDRGKSALDAVELMSVGVNYMREHVPPDVRIHSVITDGGGVPNVVPPVAEAWYFLRSNGHADVERTFAWVKDIADAAAKMTRTRLARVQVDTDIHEVLPNRALAEAMHKNLEAVGAPSFTDEERAFARATQKELGAKALALAERLEPLPATPTQSDTSTDVGPVSWFVPVGSIGVASYTFGAPSHSWQVVACTGRSIGEKGMLVAAKTLAATAIDLYRSPELVARARADFEAIRSPLRYVSLMDAP